MNYRKEIERIWAGEILWEYPLAKRTTFNVGGPAEALVAPQRVGDLAVLIKKLSQNNIPWFVLGRGSNLLVADSGVRGVVVSLERLKHCSIVAGMEDSEDDAEGQKIVVDAEAGCSLGRFLTWCMEHDLGGLEFLAGVPGSVGGAITMNAGAWGADTCSQLMEVQLLDSCGSLQTRAIEPAAISYRKWHGRKDEIVLKGRFVLKRKNGTAVRQLCQEYIEKRKKGQPRFPSAGSFFKNPPGMYAGRLIEECGLKGTRIGGAEVSALHANFIVNRGGATADEIRQLARFVQERVLKEKGVSLDPEVEIIGG